jgi:hypothetical protein
MPAPFVESVAAQDLGKIRLTWIAPAFDTRAILVSFAKDAEFTVNRRIFVMPLAAEAILTVGGGAWYARVGAAQGTPEQGIVEWSGIYGPVHISGEPTSPTLIPAPLVLHSKPVDGGYRIHTGKADPHVVIFEMGLVGDVGNRFPAGNTRWKWVAEKGHMGWVECWGMNYPETYAIRMSTFEGGAFPTDRVVLLGSGRVFPRVVCARTPFHRDFAEKQNARGDAILLHQRKVEPNMKFTSHGDYLRYQAAVVRSGDVKERTVGPAHFSSAEEGR